MIGSDEPLEPVARLADIGGGFVARDSVLVARQPIFSRAGKVQGFELLYRAAPGTTGEFDPEYATATVIANSLIGIGLDRLVGGRPAFINVTRRLLLELDPLPLPPERVVLELLEDQPVDALLLNRLRELVDRGFRIALDDFVLSDDTSALLEFASIVKLDVQALDRRALAEHVLALTGRDLMLLAEKVETPQEYADCLQMRFDAFQGFYFAKPTLHTAPSTPNYRLGLLTSLMRLGYEPSFEELEQLITQDPSLSNRFLRLANSALYTASSEIRCLHSALMRLGTTTIHRWLLVLTLAALADDPGYLLNLALQRARTCELLAEQLPDASPSRGFTVGLLSVLDALAGQPMAEIVRELPLNPEIEDALLYAQGAEGALLQIVRAYEQGTFNARWLPEIDPLVLSRTYQHAAHWADMRAALLA